MSENSSFVLFSLLLRSVLIGKGERVLTAISLYTGVGGLDFGFEAAGYRTAVAVEVDRTCCTTIRLNRSWPLLDGDINSITSREILRAGGLRKGQADVLIGGPPCQPFSKSSYWANGDADRLDDPRADTLTAFLRVLRDTKPRSFLVENVKGLSYRGKAEGLQHIFDGVRRINEAENTKYNIAWKVLNGADFGVPQLRERVFLVASRDGRQFSFPEPTHGKGREEPHRTAWDAIGDLANAPADPSLTLRGKWADLVPSIPEGQNYLWHTPRGDGLPLFGWRTRYWNFLLKLAKDRPSWTIQASPGPSTGPFHWKNRLLSPVELCRLQTFPEDLSFECPRSEIQKMLGNAVPSLLAEVLATEIRDQLLDAPLRRLRRGRSLIPPRRRMTPQPERVRRVAAQYRLLVGDHAAHAGEGLGPRGQEWQARP